MLYIGVDLGGTGIKAGAVNERGEILAKDSAPTHQERPYAEVIADIAALCGRVAAKAGATLSDAVSVGVGVPGVCDPRTGVIANCVNLGWFGVPFVAEIKKHIAQPVYVDNDATVAGYAESIAGVSAGTESSVFITLGTGVGGGIVLGGKPFSGAHGVGSEIGHMIVKMGGEPCTCGNRGCFERYASATALIREGRKAAKAHPESALVAACGGDLGAMTAKTVIDCAKAGDAAACEVFAQYVDALALGIVSLIDLLDPEIIVLGGGVSRAGDFLLDAVRAAVPEKVLFKPMPYARIELARLGNDAGIIGAALLGRR